MVSHRPPLSMSGVQVHNHIKSRRTSFKVGGAVGAAASWWAGPTCGCRSTMNALSSIRASQALLLEDGDLASASSLQAARARKQRAAPSVSRACVKNQQTRSARATPRLCGALAELVTRALAEDV